MSAAGSTASAPPSTGNMIVHNHNSDRFERNVGFDLGSSGSHVQPSPDASPSLLTRSTSTANDTLGGFYGYMKRRAFHVFIFFFMPWVYYWRHEDVTGVLALTREQIVSILSILTLVLEAIRLRFRWIGTGMRFYEQYHASALFWGTFSTMLVFLLAPHRASSEMDDIGNSAYLGCPILWCLGIVDPLLGELKHRGFSLFRRTVYGTLVSAFIWAMSAHWLASDSVFAWAIVPLMAPITVAAEYPSLAHIDDNGTMILIPLATVCLLNPWAD